MSIKKQVVMRWLTDNGFRELPRKATGHTYFEGRGVKVTLVAHGKNDLSKKLVGMLLRQLEKAGFDRDEVRREWGI